MNDYDDESLACITLLTLFACNTSDEVITEIEEEEVTDATPREDLAGLNLPAIAYNYSEIDLPIHFSDNDVIMADNTPNTNPITDEGATLGRVLFYDNALSLNNTTACASCHTQETGFTDPKQFSVGFDGGLTGRNSMSLSNARYYEPEHFFWDERAATLEEQVLMPIQDQVEMGMDALIAWRSDSQQTAYYPVFI